MQEPSSKNKKGLYRLRRADPHERLSARLRHFSFGAAVVFVVAAAGIVIHSLYNIQIKNGATFRQYAAQQQLLDSTIQATRGEIYDTSGITLASTSVVWTIWADPSYSTALFTSSKNDDTGEVTRTADPAALQEVSTQITLRLLSGDGESLDSVDTSSAAYQTQYQAVYDALSKSDSAYQTLATKVNNAIKLSIEQYVTAYNKAHKKADADKGIRKGRISVSSTKSFQRDYPYGAFAAAVLGFCDADGYGTYGLEKSYESTLAGVNGRTITLRNAYGNAIADENATTYAAKDGSNLVLSLDVNIQEVAERYLNEAISANNVENRGAAIVMNVKTGAILAMASKPDFDPNNALDYTANEAYLNELVHAEPELYGIYLKNEDGSYVTDANGNKVLDPEGDYSGYYRDIQWKNKTITELYYPGSVFKVITAAMGVDSGKATINTTLNCSGAYGVAKETYHCAGKRPTASRIWPKRCGTAATSTSSSWASASVPACSMITLTPSVSPSAPAWTCPARRTSCSITARAAWAKSSWPRRLSVRPWRSRRCRSARPSLLPSTAAISSPPMWWIRSPTRTATSSKRWGQTSAARSSARAPARPSARSWNMKWRTAPRAAAAAPTWQATASAASPARPSS